MAQTNSWGRKIKDVISVTFKRDEEDLKAFLNEQPNPADYLKMLIAKDMKNITFSIPPQGTVNEVKVEVKEESNEKPKLELSESSKKKLMALMDDDK
ncbi:MAG: hypothetical protein ACRDDE_10265 [Paraclostridium sp.]|uniref:hypothetical protein n=1 Tax=Paraclostridium sp. TaxID=2023273 RepID=UPI003EE67BDF